MISTRIRAGAGSAYETWLALGRPQNLSDGEEQLLRAHAQPAYDVQRLTGDEVAFTLAPNEVLLLEIRFPSPPAPEIQTVVNQAAQAASAK